jgi:uncharacterized FlaG/YvyC family protein
MGNFLLVLNLLGIAFLIVMKIRDAKEEPIDTSKKEEGESETVGLTKKDVEDVVKENNKEIDTIIHDKLNKLVFHLNNDTDGN